MSGPLPATRLVKPGASDTGSLPEGEPSFLEYPLEFLRANLPAQSKFVPTNLDSDAVYELVATKWAAFLVWTALYLDTMTEFAQNAPGTLRALDTEKMQAKAMAWITSTWAMMTALLVTYSDAFKVQATKSYDQASVKSLDVFNSVKSKVTPYWESIDKKYKVQELYASFKLNDLYDSIRAFIMESWEQLEVLLAGALENERVKSGLKAVKSLPDMAQARTDQARTWATKKAQDNPTLHEMTAWTIMMYTACSEKVAGFMPSE